MSASSKAARPTARPPHPALSAADIQALADGIGPVDPVEMARVEAAWADNILAPGGTDPLAVAKALRARRVGERGPQKAPTKEQATLRFPAGALDRWRATGPGWQARLGEWVARGPV